MTRLRAEKVAGIADDIPPLEVDDDDGAELLVLGWGSSYGAITRRASARARRGQKVATAHLLHLNPLPPNIGDVLRALPARAGAGDEHGPARADASAPSSSSTRDAHTKVDGPAVLRRELDEAIAAS